MLVSTLVPAVVIVVFVQLLIRQLRWPWLSYGLTFIIAAALVYDGTVHLIYTGIEVGGIGCLFTWLDPFGYWKKAKATHDPV